MLRHSGMSGVMHRQARIGHVAAFQAAGANRRMRHGPARKHRRHGHQTRQGGSLVKPSERSRGTTGQQESLIEAETVVATEVLAGPGEAFPGTPETETRDAIVAEQEAAGPCRKTRCGRRKRRHGNCIFWGYTQQCGFASSSSKDGGSPSKTNQRTPARAA